MPRSTVRWSSKEKRTIYAGIKESGRAECGRFAVKDTGKSAVVGKICLTGGRPYGIVLEVSGHPENAILGCSLAVGHVTLTHAVVVQLHPAQPDHLTPDALPVGEASGVVIF